MTEIQYWLPSEIWIKIRALADPVDFIMLAMTCRSNLQQSKFNWPGVSLHVIRKCHQCGAEEYLHQCSTQFNCDINHNPINVIFIVSNAKFHKLVEWSVEKVAYDHLDNIFTVTLNDVIIPIWDFRSIMLTDTFKFWGKFDREQTWQTLLQYNNTKQRDETRIANVVTFFKLVWKNTKILKETVDNVKKQIKQGLLKENDTSMYNLIKL